MSFPTSFHGRERRAVTESERERIPGLYSRETEGQTTCFLFKVGIQKVLSSEEERRDLDRTQI